FLLKGQIRPLVGVLMGKLRVGYLLQRGERLPAAVAGCVGADDVGGGVQIVSLDSIRTDDILQLGDRAERNHLARVIACLEQTDLCSGRAERGIGLRHHMPGAAEIVEIIDVESAKINLQRLEYVRDINVL